MSDGKRKRGMRTKPNEDNPLPGDEELFRTVIDSMLNGMAYCRMLYDESGRPIDWIYLYTNKSFEKRTGLKNVQGRRVTEVIPGIRENDPVLFDAYHRVVSTGKPLTFEVFVTALDQWFSIHAFSPSKDHFVALFNVVTEYKHAQEALQESEEKFREIIEISHDIHYRQDIRTLLLDYMSPSVERILGYTPDELKKMSISEQVVLFHSEDLPRLRSFGKELIESERRGENHIELNFRMLHKNGSIRWVNGQYFLTKDKAGQPKHVVGVLRDVTEHKLADDILRESEEKYRFLLDESIDPIFAFTREGQYRYVNRAFAEGVNRTVDQIIGKKIWDVFSKEEADKRYAALNDVFETGKLKEIEVRVPRPDGDRHYITTIAPVKNDRGDVITVICSSKNITERKRTEDRLRKSETRYRLLTENLSDVIWMTDINFQLTYVSPSCEQMFGWKAKEYVKKPYNEMVTEQSMRIISEMLSDENRLIQTGLQDYFKEGTIKLEMRRKDGTTIWTESAAKFLLDSENRPIGVQGITRDITARIKAEEERARLESQLRQAQKMESIGRLAGGVAHDFNNLLTGILGYSEILLNSLRDGDPMRDDVLEIKTSAERAAALTSRLLAFSRKQVIEPKIIDLNQLLAGLNKMLQRLIGENIELVFNPERELGRVKVDPHQMEQVMVNLAVNARDAMPGSGKLHISTSNAVIDGEFVKSHIGAAAGEYVLLSVTDTGTGIAPENMDHLFEPFFTTKEKGRGTGLGLSMVYGIVKQNNGFVFVRSELNKGTTFDVYLPRTEGDIQPIGISTQESLPRGTETILLVEDEEAVRNLAERILMHYGYRVIAVEHGGQAFLLAEISEQKIDLLLTDVIMPNINGKELYERVKSLRPGLRVLFMSGYTEDVISMHGILEEDTDFIQKPFTIDALVRKVRQVLDSGE